MKHSLDAWITAEENALGEPHEGVVGEERSRSAASEQNHMRNGGRWERTHQNAREGTSGNVSLV